MVAVNDFLPWATAPGANVESQAAYVIDPSVPIGIAHGTANSALSNKTWRQCSIAIWALGQIICDQLGINASDDGNTAGFLANLKAAITNLAWQTGDIKPTYAPAATTGWLMLNDSTFGSATSGAVNQSVLNQALFLMIYDGTSDTNAPLFTSTGVATTRGAQGTSAAAWGNNCRLTLPRQLGRVMGIAGSGAGLTPRLLGAFVGEETHLLTALETPVLSGTGSGGGSGVTGNENQNHSHNVAGNTGGESNQHTHNQQANTMIAGGPIGWSGSGSNFNVNTSVTANNNSDHTHGFNVNSGTESAAHNHNFSVTVTVTVTVNSTGGAAHNNMQPTGFVNAQVRL